MEPTPIKSWHDAAALFNQNVASVIELLQFDRDIIDVAVDGLTRTADELEARNLRSVATTLRNRAAGLERVSESDSLRPKYATMFNQCVVLLVSYFDSGIHDVFRCGIMQALRSNVDVPARIAKLDVSWQTLEEGDDQRERIFADLWVTQKDIKFQDMQSIVRAFKDALDVALDRTAHADNVIFGQAARHVIVHAGSIIDERMTRQVSTATRRTVKSDVPVGKFLRFTPDEVCQIADSMKAYVAYACAMLDARLLPSAGSLTA